MTEPPRSTCAPPSSSPDSWCSWDSSGKVSCRECAAQNCRPLCASKDALAPIAAGQDDQMFEVSYLRNSTRHLLAPSISGSAEYRAWFDRRSQRHPQGVPHPQLACTLATCVNTQRKACRSLQLPIFVYNAHRFRFNLDNKSVGNIEHDGDFLYPELGCRTTAAASLQVG